MVSGLTICIIAHFAYRAMKGGDNGHIGGVERQTSLLARWLGARGHRVSLVTWDEGQTQDEEIDGIRVLKLCRQDEGIPGIRFLHPRWTSLVRALKRSESEIYYQNCGEYVTGQVALWCRLKRRKFVYSVASDADCEGSLPGMKKIRERVLYRYGLRHAHGIIVQTRKQQRMLKENFNCDSVVIPMPGIDFGKKPMEREPQVSGTPHILWIGRICQVKRPDRILELAALCPEVHFDVVGPCDETRYAREVMEKAKKIENITIHGPVPFDQVQKFYRGKRLLVSTSDMEGFPNIYIEAWSHGLPVVSLFDPDNVIAENKLGGKAKDIPEMVKLIREFISSPEKWQSMSKNARQYFKENHSIERVLPRHEKVFFELVK